MECSDVCGPEWTDWFRPRSNRSRIAAMYALSVLCAAAACSPKVARGPRSHDDVKVDATIKTSPECKVSYMSLICSLESLQGFYETDATERKTLYAVLGLPFTFAAHPTDSPMGWTRMAGVPLMMAGVGNAIGLDMEVLEPNLFGDDTGKEIYKLDRDRTNTFLKIHRDVILSELDAGRPVLVEAGWKGAVYSWGLVTSYESSSGTFSGLVPGTKGLVELNYPPELVVLVKKAGSTRRTTDCEVVRDMVEHHNRVHQPVTKLGMWAFGKNALELWRKRLGERVFCPIYGAGSWTCHKRLAEFFVHYLSGLELLVQGCPKEPAAGRLKSCIKDAMAALSRSVADDVENFFQSEKGRRAMAFDVLALERAFSKCFASGNEEQGRGRQS